MAIATRGVLFHLARRHRNLRLVAGRAGHGLLRVELVRLVAAAAALVAALEHRLHGHGLQTFAVACAAALPCQLLARVHLTVTTRTGFVGLCVNAVRERDLRVAVAAVRGYGHPRTVWRVALAALGEAMHLERMSAARFESMTAFALPGCPFGDARVRERCD